MTTVGHGILEGGRVAPEVTSQIAALRGRGAPLEPAVRDEMSAALGHDFGDVRVHTDELAGALASAVAARAFTTGADVFFGNGEFAPRSRQGRGLLAHELAHVIQQRGAPTAGPLRVSQPGDALEREAERVGNLP